MTHAGPNLHIISAYSDSFGKRLKQNAPPCRDLLSSRCSWSIISIIFGYFFADLKDYSKSISGRVSEVKLIFNTVKRVYKWQNHWVEISSELTKISVKLTAIVFNDTIVFRLYPVFYKRHNRKSSWMLPNECFLFSFLSKIWPSRMV